MNEIRKRLESELHRTMDRLRQIGGGTGIEDQRGAPPENTALADEVDMIRVNVDREMSFATRSLLVERANKLADALERLRDGAYGICEECDGKIPPARLRVMPEVTTCVRCQDQLERMANRLETVGALFGAEENAEED